MLKRLVISALMLISGQADTAVPVSQAAAGNEQVIHVFGNPDEDSGKKVEIYKPFEAQSLDSVKTVFNKSITCHGIGQIGSKIFLLYGSQSSNLSVQTHTPGCATNAGVVPPLSGDRQYAASGILGNSFCVCGGNYATPSTSCECLDSDTYVWRSIPNMNTGRILFDMATLNGGNTIYAIGGVKAGPVILNTVEKYTVGDPAWTSVQPMHNTRNDHKAVAYDDNTIYVCGDGFMHPHGRFCEMYNARTDTWTEIANTNSIFMDFGFVKYDRYLFAFGGGQPGVEKTVEYYDPQNNTWTRTINLLEPRNWVCAITLDD